jgi:hypothetical protein
MNGDQTYEAPAMTLAGTAESLTRGGYYDDYDSPGVRKTRKRWIMRQPSKKLRQTERS